jgi:uncharacterized protein
MIDQTAIFVKDQLAHDTSGHGWWHIHRVWHMAQQIQTAEGGDRQAVELGALLHDIADHKFTDGDTEKGPQVAGEWLHSIGARDNLVKHVQQIIREVSFKGANVPDRPTSLESEIVQDADRLDAVGAIGIARTFAYGGSTGNPIHDPSMDPILHDSFEQYRGNRSSTINHFYEKLLLLKDRMHTKTAKSIAVKRHEFMEAYLDRFFAEWKGLL